jgi:hypothetical protein
MNMALSFLFWAVFASYVVHIVDETLIGGGFVAKVQQHWWPSYTARMFFFFNAAFLTIVALCNLAYDLVGRPVLFLPLAFAVAFATHGVTFHLWWTLCYRRISDRCTCRSLRDGSLDIPIYIIFLMVLPSDAGMIPSSRDG